MEASTANLVRKVLNLAALTALWASGPLLTAAIADSPDPSRRPAPILSTQEGSTADAAQRRSRPERAFCENELVRC